MNSQALRSICITLLTLIGSCSAADSVAVVIPRIVRVIPHDTAAFTQGLVYQAGKLYESTGTYENSRVRCIDAATGAVERSVDINNIAGWRYERRLFGEGLALMGDELVQLTWREGVAIRWRKTDFTPLGSWQYSGEGWGLTQANDGFVMSNGSDTLYFRNKRFAIISKLPVTLYGKPLFRLNELEYHGGALYANVWYDTNIYRIDTKSGAVTRIIDCTTLIGQARPKSRDAVLNGIAYNHEAGTFYITGKNWRAVFEVQL
jgi:glutaminyl-peptide cyclotransferase